MIPQICENHRKELLRFLLLKTAAVRSGVKPGELLRIRHCYQTRNQEGLQFCLYLNDILEILELSYLELQNGPESSLILFYHPQTMRQTLAKAENMTILSKYHYPVNDAPEQLLSMLQERFAATKLPHEVGVFIGYPAKDVAGFIDNLPRTSVHRGDWAVFGDAGESVALMHRYRQIEHAARRILESSKDLETFFTQIFNLKHHKEYDKWAVQQ